MFSSPMSPEDSSAEVTSSSEADFPETGSAGGGAEERRAGPGQTRRVFPIVGIGASAGGVEALSQFFGQLPAGDSSDGDPSDGNPSDGGPSDRERSGEKPAEGQPTEGQPQEEVEMAFVVVLHLPPDGESHLAEILRQKTTLDVAQAEAGSTLESGTVYVMEPGRPLTISEGRFQAERDEPKDEASGDGTPGDKALGETAGLSTIDRLFRSLAADQEERAAGILLSGSGGDGTLGLRAIKESGGVTVAQSPEDAAHEGMPQSAIEAGAVDLVLPAAQIAGRLAEYRDWAGRIQLPETESDLAGRERDTLQAIFAEVAGKTGVDFADYKRSTILRRLQRRLQIREVESLDGYLGLLREEEAEVEALWKDFLIGVTSFFRASEAFETLSEAVLPGLFEGKGPGDEVRVWVPGCATGEEAYSIAMLLREEAEARAELANAEAPDIQVFATDVDEEALGLGRRGRYPKAAGADLLDERYRRFFQSGGDFLQVRNTLREIVLFARHNLLEDPPFSDLDLISCRNLLMYLNPKARRHVYELFHYGLRPQGYLFLGRSEAPQQAGSLFSEVDREEKIFQARALSENDEGRGIPIRPALSGESSSESSPKERDAPTGNAFAAADGFSGAPSGSPFFDREFSRSAGQGREAEAGRPDVADVHQRALLKEVPSALVDDQREIVHLSGPAGRYLRHEEGRPSNDLLAKVPEGLRPSLHSALQAAFREGKATRRAGIRADFGEGPREVSISVRPLAGEAARESADRESADRESADREGVSKGSAAEGESAEEESAEEEFTKEEFARAEAGSEESERYVLVRFAGADRKAGIDEEAGRRSAEEGSPEQEDHEAQLRRDLRDAEKRLQSTVEEHEATREEMETAGEELLSMNEELQSKNEELETSQEELRSVNDELETANRKLESKIEEARRSKEALENLMEATEIATLVLDPDLKIQRFTPPAAELFNIRSSDTGRPLTDFTSQFEPEGLREDLQAVLSGAAPIEREVRRAGGEEENRWYLVRIRPYHRTRPSHETDGEITGVLLTFVNISERRRLERRLVNTAEEMRRRIGQDLHDVLGADLTHLTLRLENYKYELEQRGDVNTDPIDRVVEEAKSAARHARSLSHELVPTGIQDKSLAAALQELCGRKGDEPGSYESEGMPETSCTFEGEPDETLPRSDKTATQMYRIASEALVNARRHAEAEHVSIHFGRADGKLEMRIRDDGIGLPDDIEKAAGIGLRTMRYRARLIGGTLSLGETPGGGTTVRCSLPLDRARALGSKDDAE